MRIEGVLERYVLELGRDGACVIQVYRVSSAHSYAFPMKVEKWLRRRTQTKIVMSVKTVIQTILNLFIGLLRNLK